METILKEAKQYRKGDFILIDDTVCRVSDIAISKPGKHGSAKARITAISLLDNKKKEIVKPANAKIPAPIIEKKEGQLVMKYDDKNVQVMDLETYEMIDAILSEEIDQIEEGVKVEYWIIGNTNVVMRIKKD